MYEDDDFMDQRAGDPMLTDAMVTDNDSDNSNLATAASKHLFAANHSGKNLRQKVVVVANQAAQAAAKQKPRVKRSTGEETETAGRTVNPHINSQATPVIPMRRVMLMSSDARSKANKIDNNGKAASSTDVEKIVQACDGIVSKVVSSLGPAPDIQATDTMETKFDKLLNAFTNQQNTLKQFCVLVSDVIKPALTSAARKRTNKVLAADPLAEDWTKEEIKANLLFFNGKIRELSEIGNKRAVYEFVKSIQQTSMEPLLIGTVDYTNYVDEMLDAWAGRFDHPIKMFMATLQLCFSFASFTTLYFPMWGSSRRTPKGYVGDIPDVERQIFLDILQRQGPILLARRIKGNYRDQQVYWLDEMLRAAMARIRTADERPIRWYLPVEKSTFVPLFSRADVQVEIALYDTLGLPLNASNVANEQLVEGNEPIDGDNAAPANGETSGEEDTSSDEPDLKGRKERKRQKLEDEAEKEG